MDRNVPLGEPDLKSGVESPRRYPEFLGPVNPSTDHEPEYENDHLALVYEDREEQFSAVIPFIAQGLDWSEKCLYIAHERSKEEVRNALETRGVDVDKALQTSQLVLLSPSDTYLRTGEFDQDAMMQYLEHALDRVNREEDYSGVRTASEMTWALDRGTPTEKLLEFEAMTNTLYQGGNYVGLCQYNRDRFSPELIYNVIRTHPHLIHDGTVYHNVYYTPPEEYFGPKQHEREVERMLGTLREKTESITALHEHERQISTLMENVPGMVYRCRNDRGWPMEFVSKGFRDLTGYDPKALEHGELSFGEDIVVEEDREKLWKEVQQGLNDNGTFLVTYRVNTADGEERWVRERGREVHDNSGDLEALEGVIIDVTESKRLENEFEEMLGRVTDAFYAVDEEFQFTHVNSRAEELLQRPEEELLGENLWELYPEAAKLDEVWESFHTALREQEPASFEVYFRPLDFWVEANLYPSSSGVSVYFRDVTERVERERELARANKRLKMSNERLEQFAYVASHDLQEPLRMVSSYLQLLEGRYSDELDDDAEEFIYYAVDGAERMREMIDDLLAYSRIDTDAGPLEPTETETVIENVLRDLKLQIRETDAEINVGSLPTVVADSNQLEQVFQNLVSNAIKYRGDEPPQIEISAERDGKKWVFRVTDNGIGMEPEQTDHIFKVFDRLHTPDEYPGTGIGLALCEKIITRHGGEIWATSDPGEGAEFSFTLPAEHSSGD